MKGKQIITTVTTIGGEAIWSSLHISFVIDFPFYFFFCICMEVIDKEIIYNNYINYKKKKHLPPLSIFIAIYTAPSKRFSWGS